MREASDFRDPLLKLATLTAKVANEPGLARAVARAANCADGHDARLFAAEQQIEAHARLAQAAVDPLPGWEHIQARCAGEYPDDYVMLLDEREQQQDAFVALTSARGRLASEPQLIGALVRAEREYPYDYSMQLHELTEQEEALGRLRAQSSVLSSDPKMIRLMQRLDREYPDDPSMQHCELEEQVEASAAIRSMLGAARPGDAVYVRVAQLEVEYPEDYSMQFAELETLLESAPTADVAEAIARRTEANGSHITRMSDLKTTYSARGLAGYQIDLWHDELNKHRTVSGRDLNVVQHKAEQQAREWDRQWSQAHAKNSARKHAEDNKAMAAQRSAAALTEQQQLRRLLFDSLARDPCLPWEDLYESVPFAMPAPVAPISAAFTPRVLHAAEPQRSDACYQPAFGWLDRLMAARRERKEHACQVRFEQDLSRWQALEIVNARENEEARLRHTERDEQAQRHYRATQQAWEQAREAYAIKQCATNAVLMSLKAGYERAEPEDVAAYCQRVLERAPSPTSFPSNHRTVFQPDGRMLLVGLMLPALAEVARLKEVRYVAARDLLEEKFLSEPEHTKLYDDVLYQLVIRALADLFRADYAQTLETIVLNGFVTALNPATGHAETVCILSVRVTTKEFAAFNLMQIEPRACFRQLKGIGSSKLHGLTPVAPIVQLSFDDPRLVTAYAVASTLNTETNLAAMDWEDFEHLIREVLAKEYATSGGEVRVTQASRDGGVDAIAFDPDPIRGGKVVIQAKRYTNTVPVSAVRELYGTLVNEGAMKGLLVTTAGYGPDAYEFAKGKPITLIDGAGLLYLLGKHGHRARIDVLEARRSLATAKQRYTGVSEKQPGR